MATRLTSAARREVALQRLNDELERDLADYERSGSAQLMREVLETPEEPEPSAAQLLDVIDREPEESFEYIRAVSRLAGRLNMMTPADRERAAKSNDSLVRSFAKGRR